MTLSSRLSQSETMDRSTLNTTSTPSRTVSKKTNVVSLVGGCCLGVLLGLPLSFMRPTGLPHGEMVLALGETTLEIPAALMRGGTLEPNPQRLDLSVNWSDFGPANPGSDDSLAMTLLPAGDNLPPERWPSAVYARYVEADIEVIDGGLLRRKFKDDSPFSGETLYMATSGEGDFAARCADVMADVPTYCMTTFRRGGLDIVLRFRMDHLTHWQEIVGKADALVQKAKRRGVA
jgi:hypothetical protein